MTDSIVHGGKRRVAITVAVSALIMIAGLVAAAFMLTDRSIRDPVLIGQWKSWRSDFRITKEGELYKIVVNNPNGLLGGTYVGHYRDGALQVAGPMAPRCPHITYVGDTGKLEFCGEEFARVGD